MQHNINLRSKSLHNICPRCRFHLAMTHSKKLICKKCGYTSVIFLFYLLFLTFEFNRINYKLFKNKINMRLILDSQKESVLKKIK